MTGRKRILLVIGGGIAAYKCLDLIRRARERGYHVTAVMTQARGLSCLSSTYCRLISRAYASR